MEKTVRGDTPKLLNSKHKQFGCVKPNKSGQTLLNIAKDLKLFYVNQLEPNRYTREDPVHGTSDILDMAFITPGLSFRDILSVADDRDLLTCQLSVTSYQLSVISYELSVVSYQLLSVSCQLLLKITFSI